jgi:hypothetical protein
LNTADGYRADLWNLKKDPLLTGVIEVFQKGRLLILKISEVKTLAEGKIRKVPESRTFNRNAPPPLPPDTVLTSKQFIFCSSISWMWQTEHRLFAVSTVSLTGKDYGEVGCCLSLSLFDPPSQTFRRIPSFHMCFFLHTPPFFLSRSYLPSFLFYFQLSRSMAKNVEKGRESAATDSCRHNSSRYAILVHSYFVPRMIMPIFPQSLTVQDTLSSSWR